MSPREIFSITVRGVGLWAVLYLGLWNLLAMAISITGDLPEQHRGDNVMSFGCGVVFSVVGLILIRSPNLVVDFAFGVEKVIKPSVEAQQEPPGSKVGE